MASELSQLWGESHRQISWVEECIRMRCLTVHMAFPHVLLRWSVFRSTFSGKESMLF